MRRGRPRPDRIRPATPVRGADRAAQQLVAISMGEGCFWPQAEVRCSNDRGASVPSASPDS